MMAWVNPFPEKGIDSIDFVSKNMGVPILVAITTAEKARIAKREASTPERMAQAKELTAKADLHVRQKQYAEAEKIYQESMGVAADYLPAYLGLGYLYEGQKKFKEAIDVYEKSIQSLPEGFVIQTGFEPYMRIGKCWEQLNNYAQAVETYRRSLDANINQPEIMKALEEAKRKLKGP